MKNIYQPWGSRVYGSSLVGGLILVLGVAGIIADGIPIMWEVPVV